MSFTASLITLLEDDHAKGRTHREIHGFAVQIQQSSKLSLLLGG